jgi:peptide/nickel transport system substrate-binding protein
MTRALLRRRTLLGAAAALPLPALAASTSTFRFVPATDLVALDPVFLAPPLVAVAHGYHVFDTLYGVDGAMRPQPQMAESHEVSDNGLAWTIRLRPGLLFHDGAPVLAADCVASLQRWCRYDLFGRALASVLDRMVALDDRTFRIELQKPFPLLLDALGKPHTAPAFIMPARILPGSPDRQISELIGSGPYRFLANEHDPGNLVAYAKFDRYIPRNEKSDWTSGGKVAHFDRIEWHIIPDKATAAAALQQGEVDMIESIPADLVPLLAKDHAITIDTADPLGTVLLLRFNHVVPPFDNAALRRFVMSISYQPDYLATVTNGTALGGKLCRAMFPCTIPGMALRDSPQFGSLTNDKGAIAAALQATGYGGEKIVIINPSDNAAVSPLGLVTADLLQRAGLNVELQTVDWGTMMQRRLSRARSNAGGWSIYHSTFPCIGLANPVLNTPMRGEGDKGWPGWYSSDEVEKLTADWLAADTDANRHRLVEQLDQVMLRDVPTLPLGIFYPATAYRADIGGVLAGQVRFPWNIFRA